MSDDEAQPKRKKVEHYVAVYVVDFTFFGIQGVLPPAKAFVDLIRPLFSKWAFQEEECPKTGKHHYQGRGSLFKKKRVPDLWKLLNDTDLRGMDVSESSCNSKSNEIFYALKYETRVDGPWTDKTWRDPPYIPRQYRGLIDRLYPWQKRVLDSRTEFNDRCVNMIVDTGGCNGKSTVAALGDLHYGGIDLPPVGDHKELLQCCCDILMAKECRDPQLVFVDLPRSLTTDPKKFGPFMTAIEQIKKGKVFDMRFHYKEWWFDSPQVWVFANHPPNLQYMSEDRWRFWKIEKFFNDLVPLTKAQLCQLCQTPQN